VFSNEIVKLLIEVITSWQVIAATITIVIFIFIVNNVTRTSRRIKAPKLKIKRKRASPLPTDAIPEEGSGGGSINDELGLEEA
jgi:hypothetical protein